MPKEYIEREVANEFFCQTCDTSEGTFCVRCDGNPLKSIPAADVVERPRWIPVTERLPEDGSDVLAYLDSRITVANYYKGTWQDCVMGRLYLTEEGFVTHWMPLPKAPEPPKDGMQ